jgi:hypothetical protein
MMKLSTALVVALVQSFQASLMTRSRVIINGGGVPRILGLPAGCKRFATFILTTLIILCLHDNRRGRRGEGLPPKSCSENKEGESK